MAQNSPETSIGALHPHVLVGAALVVLLALGGCAQGRRCAVPTTSNGMPSCYPRGVCSGYVSTCWRRCLDVYPCPQYVPEEPDAGAGAEYVPLPQDKAELSQPDARGNENEPGRNENEGGMPDEDELE